MAELATPDVNADRSQGDGIEGDIRAAIKTVTEAAPATPSGPQRDASGKFLPAGTDTGAQAAAAPTTATEGDPSAPLGTDPTAAPAQAAASADGTLAAPEKWSELDKQAFASLPPEGQKLLLDRYKGFQASYTQAMQGISTLKRDYEPVASLFKPYEAQMQAIGMTPEAFTKSYLTIESRLMNGELPQVTIEAMKAYKVDPNAVVRAIYAAFAPGQQPPAGAAAPSNQDYVDPQVQSLRAELQRLNQQVNGVTSHLTAQQNTERQAKEASTYREMDNFGAQKTPEGKPAYPFFNDAVVMQRMAHLAGVARQEGQTPVLKDLYSEAVWSLPAYRDRLLAEQRQTEAAERLNQDRTKASAARIAGSSVSGAPGGSGPTRGLTNPSASLRDDLMAAWQTHSPSV